MGGSSCSSLATISSSASVASRPPARVLVEAVDEEHLVSPLGMRSDVGLCEPACRGPLGLITQGVAFLLKFSRLSGTWFAEKARRQARPEMRSAVVVPRCCRALSCLWRPQCRCGGIRLLVLMTC